jgi:hypothetical protein
VNKFLQRQYLNKQKVVSDPLVSKNVDAEPDIDPEEYLKGIKGLEKN